MTQPTAWAHLPNARHIDAILTDVKARQAVWATARNDTWYMSREVAWGVVRGTPRRQAWASVWSVACDVARVVRLPAGRSSVHAAAWPGLCALIAWDDSARMLDMSPAALRTLIDIAEGDVKHQAVLLLPAVIALNSPNTGGSTM